MASQLLFSVNNHYVGLIGKHAPNFSNAWLLFKTKMKEAGWTISQSAAQTLSTPQNTDVITDAYWGPGGMSSPTVWWVMRDPGGVRELLFYRPNAIDQNSIHSYINAANMAIAYSANDKFSLTDGLGGEAVSATNPPIANDMVWLHQPDTYIGTGTGASLSQPGLMTDDVNWGDGPLSNPNSINFSNSWNFHMCAEMNLAPYPFYFWFTKQNQTTGFFCMDSIQDTHPLDYENVIFYHFPNDGGVHDISIQELKTWYQKPLNFSDRDEFVKYIDNNEARFLTTSTVDLVMDYESPTDLMTVIPRGLPSSLYLAKDELFPVMYVRNTSQTYYNDILSVPPSYKGLSSFIKHISSARKQFDTFSISSIRDRIAVGNDPTIAIPWNGEIINI